MGGGIEKLLMHFCIKAYSYYRKMDQKQIEQEAFLEDTLIEKKNLIRDHIRKVF